MTVTVADVVEIFPRPLTEFEMTLAGNLVKQSLELIVMEFARRGRDLSLELVASTWLIIAVKQAVREMVSKAVIVGENVGRASASSTTGPQSDTITWSQGIGIQWGGVGITPEVLKLLGLIVAAVPRGRGGSVVPFGAHAPVRGAEFSERGRC